MNFLKRMKHFLFFNSESLAYYFEIERPFDKTSKYFQSMGYTEDEANSIVKFVMFTDTETVMKSITK